MRKVILYIAQSLDGFIAEKNGGVSFLDNFNEQSSIEIEYRDFFGRIDITIMGNNTYQQILQFDVPFPYQGKKNFVLTRKTNQTDEDYIHYYTGDIPALVNRLKAENDGDIWLIGGSEVNTLFLHHGLIDEIWLFIAPTLLGDGIPLFGKVPENVKLTPIHTKYYTNRITLIQYQVNY